MDIFLRDISMTTPGGGGRSVGPGSRPVDGACRGTTARWGRAEGPDASGVHAAAPLVITPRPMDTTGSCLDAGVAPVPRAGDAEAQPDASAGVRADGGGSTVTDSSTTPAGPARATAAAEASDGSRSPFADSVAPVGPPVQLLFGMDKGGRTSTVKVYLGIANQRRPASVGNSVVIGVFPCRTDDYAALRRICALWLADIEDLRSRGLLVGGVLTSVLLILTGDYAWMTAFCGHSGASSRHPCLLCSAVGPRWEGDEQLVAFYGCLQHGSQCRGEPRTVVQAAEVCRALGSCSENASLARPMTHDQHRSIRRRPLMLVPASDIATMPLRTTLGITTDLLHLAAQIVQASCGPVRAAKFCEELGGLLLERAGVTPAPYFGGTFEGSECHRIGRKLTLVSSLLEKYAPPRWVAPYRRACGDWQALLPTLNRSVAISAHDADEFERRAASFVDGLRASFDWVTVTPKMHVLVCHSAAFLRRFGSLGRYSEQALEALHGRFNQEAALHTAGTFLGSCGEFVKASAMSRAPGGDLYNN